MLTRLFIIICFIISTLSIAAETPEKKKFKLMDKEAFAELMAFAKTIGKDLKLKKYVKGESQLGLDYLQITKNPILVDIMLELEPKLLASYAKETRIKISNNHKNSMIKRIAEDLSEDKTFKSTVDKIIAVSPDTPLKFLKLSKEKYPMFWAIGRNRELDIELASSKKLYKALHGKEYVEN